MLVAMAASAAIAFSADDRIVLRNGQVCRELTFDGQVWRTTRFARADETDELRVRSDEFHMLFMDDAELSIDQYAAEARPERLEEGDVTRIVIRYVPRKGIALPTNAPSRVTVTYRLSDEPYLRKDLVLEMAEGQTIDRLEVERFVTSSPASRGGRGEPVFLGKAWFVGVEYPAFYSRHTDGNTPAAYSGPYDRLGNYSFIDLEGRDVAKRPRPGLVRLMHFPGYAKKGDDGKWRIVGKTAVAGVGRLDDPQELVFLDYLNIIRRPVRTFVHYNNWYDGQGKRLSIDNFVNRTFLTFKENLDPYGVRIDAMVPDNGWQNRGSSVYEPNPRQFPKGMDDFEALGKALRDAGTNLGLWMALNGYSSNINWGKTQGYHEAVRNRHFSRFMRYYSIVEEKYNRKIRERLVDLIRRGGIMYIKHDFNEMCDTGAGRGHLPTDRHGHEASVDAELGLLALERRVNPEIYQNITNWIWFSPWWLQHGNNLWMLAGDHGVNRNWPSLSTRKMAITYRDAHLFRAWGSPATRPLVPISHLMTHGIIFADRCRVEQPGDTLRDWADYVVMYYARGLQLKEWYITPSMMTPERWRVLGQATRWSEENVETLANSVYVGGRADRGEVYGYVCWRDDRGILTLRNPSPAEGALDVPFDKSVWYRGERDVPFRARVIYPYQDDHPQAFASCKPMHVSVPGYTTLVMQLEAGQPKPTAAEPSTPPIAVEGRTLGQAYAAQLVLPKEAMQRCELVMIIREGTPVVRVDRERVDTLRTNRGRNWRMASVDLAPYLGRTVALDIRPATTTEDLFADEDGRFEAWLLTDRPVPSSPMGKDVRLPYALAHGFRRQTVRLFAETQFSGAPPQTRSLTDKELKSARAAKLRIQTFDVDGPRYGKKSVLLNGQEVISLPRKKRGDTWENHIFPLPVEKLSLLQRENIIRIVHEGRGDKFKVRKLTLAVELPTGQWVRSTTEGQVHTSYEDWAHYEGLVFEDQRQSRPIRLTFR